MGNIVLFLCTLLIALGPLTVNSAKLRESCLTDIECTVAGSTCDFIACAVQVCLCPAGKIVSKDQTKCVNVKWLGEVCSGDDACLVGGICNTVTGKCACPVNQRSTADGMQCVDTYNRAIMIAARSGLKETCRQVGAPGTDGYCDKMEQECVNNTCACQSGYEEATKDQLILLQYSNRRCVYPNFAKDTYDPTYCEPVAKMNLTDKCTTDGQCPGNATCVWKDCFNKMCVCNDGFIAQYEDQCRPVAAINESCSRTDKSLPYCIDYGTDCGLGGLCVCSGVFRTNAQETGCLPDEFTGLAKGESCSLTPTYDLAEMCGPGQICGADGTCTCYLELYRDVSPFDFQAFPIKESNIECIYKNLKWFPQSNYSTECAGISITTTPAPIPVGLAETCNATTSCPGNSSCILDCNTMASTCVCGDGYTAKADNSICLKIALIGESCDNDTQCIYSAYSKSDCKNGTCGCQTTFRSDNSYCLFIWPPSYNTKGLGESCDSTNKCASGELNCTGAPTTTCKCPDGYIETTPEQRRMTNTPFKYCISTTPTATPPTCTTTAPPTQETTIALITVNIGAHCDATRVCPSGATCIATNCNDTRCRCDRGNSASADKTKCLLVRSLGQTCDHGVTQICLGENFVNPTSECSGSNLCQCTAAASTSDGVYCVVSIVKLYGDACTAIPDLCISATCTSSKCACSSGKTVTTSDDKLDEADFYYCKANTMTANERTPFTCASSQTSGLYEFIKIELAKREEAKAAEERRIAEEERAETPKVVLIASLVAVGVFVLVAAVFIVGWRHARRQRQKAVECETSSESSTLSLFRGYKNWFRKENTNTNPMY